MNFSYGFVETRGFIAAIEAADAMLKAAKVELVSRRKAGGALVMVIVKGRLDACRAAVDAGSAAADRIGELISAHVIPNPYGDTEQLVSQYLGGRKKKKQAQAVKSTAQKKQPVQKRVTKEKKAIAPTRRKQTVPSEKKEAPKKAIPSKAEREEKATRKTAKKTDSFSPQEKLLHLMTAAPEGITLTQLADAFGTPAADVRVLIKKLMDRGVVEKVQKKYFLINGGQTK